MSELGLDERVLLKIAQGVNTFYALTVKEKVGSNDGVLAAIDRLQNNGLIVQGEIGPRNSKPYLITEDGFDYVLRFIREIDDITSFVESCVDYFPLVFGYWNALGNYDLCGWVLDNLKSEIPKIDIEIQSELLKGDRERFSHLEFINLLYTRIYGPWLKDDRWENFIKGIPVDRVTAFLSNHPAIMKTRESEYVENSKKIETQRYNNEKYKTQVLDRL